MLLNLFTFTLNPYSTFLQLFKIVILFENFSINITFLLTLYQGNIDFQYYCFLIFKLGGQNICLKPVYYSNCK